MIGRTDIELACDFVRKEGEATVGRRAEDLVISLVNSLAFNGHKHEAKMLAAAVWGVGADSPFYRQFA